MQRDAPLDATVAAAEGEFVLPKSQSRRFTVTVGIALALVIVAAAWVVTGREDLSRIGSGGQNLSLLPKVGQPAPDFVTFTAAGGRPVRLSDYRGKGVWLNFWGSWCPPCRAEMPELQAAYAEYLEPHGIALLAVSLNEPAEAAADFAARNNVTFTVLSDPRRLNTGAAYPIANFPTHILIDRDGIVRDIVLAAIDKEEIIERAGKIAPDQGSD